MKIDIHIYSNASSESEMSPDTIIRTAIDMGLHGVCITDTNTMELKGELEQLEIPEGFLVVVGMYYPTDDGDFILFGPVEDIEAGLGAEDMLLTVREREGFAVAANPFRDGHIVAERLIEKGLCTAVERLAGTSSDDENIATDRWFEIYPLIECGGSGSCMPESIGSIVTEFFVQLRSEEDFIYALKQGLCEARHNCQDKIVLM